MTVPPEPNVGSSAPLLVYLANAKSYPEFESFRVPPADTSCHDLAVGLKGHPIRSIVDISDGGRRDSGGPKRRVQSASRAIPSDRKAIASVVPVVPGGDDLAIRLKGDRQRHGARP